MYVPGVMLSRQHHSHKVYAQRACVEYNKEKVMESVLPS